MWTTKGIVTKRIVKTAETCFQKHRSKLGSVSLNVAGAMGKVQSLQHFYVVLEIHARQEFALGSASAESHDKLSWVCCPGWGEVPLQLFQKLRWHVHRVHLLKCTHQAGTRLALINALEASDCTSLHSSETSKGYLLTIEAKALTSPH